MTTSAPARAQRPTLPPKDEARVAPAVQRLDECIEESQRQTQRIERLGQDLDSDRISVDGVILDVADDEDSLVHHVDHRLHSLPTP